MLAMLDNRNGLSDIRGPLKKSGAGFANWGCPGEEFADIQEQVKSLFRPSTE